MLGNSGVPTRSMGSWPTISRHVVLSFCLVTTLLKLKFFSSFWVCCLYRGQHFVGHKGCIEYQLSMSSGLGSKVLSTMSCKAKVLLWWVMASVILQGLLLKTYVIFWWRWPLDISLIWRFLIREKWSLKSVNMEKRALQNILERITDVLTVGEVVTDASASIKKIIGEFRNQCAFAFYFANFSSWLKTKVTSRTKY